jgi:predicted phosphodiesterase
VARGYCERYPNASTASLARLAKREHPRLFKTPENARDAIRWHRGTRSTRNGRKAHQPIAREPIDIPASDARTIAPWAVPVRGRGIVASDLHVPYHDVDAIRLMLEYAEGHGYTDYVIINGDLLDCYQLSHWLRDPDARNFAGELDKARQLLQVFASRFGKVIYKLGNHESRFTRYMMERAPELLGIPWLSFDNLLGNPDTREPVSKWLGVEIVPDNRVMTAGALTILHGHEYGKGLQSPVNPAKGMFNKAVACTLNGHLHQTSQHTQRTIEGRQISCWSTGCLCGLTPDYAPLNKWDHGFAAMEFDGKNFEVSPKRIVHGRVY